MKPLEGGFPSSEICTKFTISGVCGAQQNAGTVCICSRCCTAYKDLEDRNETRQSAWETPGWDECVIKTGWENALSLCYDVFSLSLDSPLPLFPSIIFPSF